MIFQDPYGSLNPRMTVGEAVGEAIDIHNLAESSAARQQRIEGLLKSVGLDPTHAERYPHEFSGGQRQRIGIARAFLKNAPILLLDEPTSALDPSTEAAIMETIKDLMHGRTTLIVTHRLATIHGVDRIVVLENGRIVEQGSGAELLARRGVYATLYAAGNYPSHE
jgi:ABC-type microcin C transport system duplicated ATPase subunit YejF